MAIGGEGLFGDKGASAGRAVDKGFMAGEFDENGVGADVGDFEALRKSLENGVQPNDHNIKKYLDGLHTPNEDGMRDSDFDFGDGADHNGLHFGDPGFGNVNGIDDFGHYGDTVKLFGYFRVNKLYLDILTAVLVLFLILSIVRFHWDGILAFWRRRKAAARYKRNKKDDGLSVAQEDGGDDAGEEEPTLMETIKAVLMRDERAQCTIDSTSVGGRSYTIDAHVSTLEKVSELPFLLQESCRYSGVHELKAISLVDQWLHDRARITLTDAAGKQHEVGRNVTPGMIRRARSFRVVLLPQNTR